MIMRARQDGNVIVFELEGHLDFETTIKFQETCENLVKKNSEQRIVLNMEKLKFVGSSGINQFIQAVKDFDSFPAKPKLCKLSSEFEMIFKAYQTARHPFDIFEAEPEAIAAFDLPPAPKKVSKKKKATPPPIEN